MKVKGIRTFTILDNKLKKCRKACHQKREAEAPLGIMGNEQFNLALDVVAQTQNRKCGLKYEILSPTSKVGEFILSLDARFLPRFGDLK